jgi:feruloyl-CoA synthase
MLSSITICRTGAIAPAHAAGRGSWEESTLSDQPTSEVPFRPVRMADCRASVEPLGGGELLVRNVNPLSPYPRHLTERLDAWAQTCPDRTWLAARDRNGNWERVSYGEGRARVRRIASALIERNLSAERPMVILSGNGISHALIATAALYAGVPYAPVSTAYSLVSSDFAKLRHIFDLLTPGLVFVSNPAAYARAIETIVPAEIEIVADGVLPSDRPVTPFQVLEAAKDTGEIDTVRRAIGPDTIAKFLFTSGSTGLPKAVINTQRMLCANVEQITSHFAYFRDTPPVILDWAPWNHTAGGNHNFNLILYNGGTLYIDDGRPTPGGIAATVRNLREVAPTWYFNVPKGYDALIPHLQADRALRQNFFKNLKLLWYAGAGMAQHIWDALDSMTLETIGERITILTGLGATETGPFAMAANQTMLGAGRIGLPAQGCDFKLVPVDGKFEARVRGPNVTPGYWRQEQLTKDAFDADGFYKIGDAIRLADEADVNQGFYFDGRIAEDFKLSTGTWVAVGPLRGALIDHCAPYIQDVVITGLDRPTIAALIFPDLDNCRRLAGLPSTAGLAEVAANPQVRAHLAKLLSSFAAKATGSSNRIARAMLLSEEPSIDSGEITDKGSLNQRAVLKNRTQELDELYAEPPLPHVIDLGAGAT